MIKPRKIIRATISYIPVMKIIIKKKSTGPLDGEYYYRIYSYHMNALKKLSFQKGGIIAEFGPGDTLGIGICAILDGFNLYYAFDKIRYADNNKNIKVLNEIKKYFRVDECLLSQLENSLFNEDGFIRYITDWDNKNIIKSNSIDLIISNAVMEHIIDIKATYELMYNWLKPGGWCSHVIDYGAHEFSDNWFEHLYINKYFWKFLMHGRIYPINRYPHSYHIYLSKSVGFEIMHEIKQFAKKADINKISSGIKDLFTEEDLFIKSSHIILRKPRR